MELQSPMSTAGLARTSSQVNELAHRNLDSYRSAKIQALKWKAVYIP